MPNFTTDHRLKPETLAQLVDTLPAFDPSCATEIDQADEVLKSYLTTYGFDKVGGEAELAYSLGVLSFANYTLVAHAWVPAAPKATVFVVHGLFDHIGIYLDLVDMLVTAGFAVVAIDFPGHGLSKGPRAVIDDFSQYAVVIDGALTAIGDNITTPLYAIGQSTGCAAILNYVLASEGEKFERLVLLAPLIQPCKWAWVSWSHFFLNRFIDFIPRSFTVNSHREAFNDFLVRYDTLQPRQISVRWVGAMKRWVQGFDQLPENATPTLIIQGDRDGTVDWRVNLPRLQKKLLRNEVSMVSGAMHHLVNEGDAWRERVFQEIIRFLRQ